MSSARKPAMDEIEELYRDLDSHVIVEETAAADATSLSVPAATKLKHAQTNACFTEEPIRKDLDISERGSTLLGLGQNGGQRFDSHNILRSDEAADLVHMPEEQQIWLKRPENSLQSQSVGSTLDGVPSRKASIVSPLAGPSRTTPSADNMTNSFPKPTALSTSKSDHYDLVRKSQINPSLVSSLGVPNGSRGGDAEDALDGASLLSSERSRNTTRKSEKSLTRRLSSFFTRSFRRKKKDGTEGSEGKRYSTLTTGSERPGSADTRISLEQDQNDLTNLRSQQLLRLGFSLNIDEALRNQPDSFVFVPFTDSGYFSSNFDEFEKLPQFSVDEEDVSLYGEEINSPSPLSEQRPPIPPPRRINNVAQGDSVQRSVPRTKSSDSAAHNRQSQPWRDTAKGKSQFSPAMSCATTPDNDSADRANPRRLSFVEGTSVMERIDQLTDSRVDVLAEQHFSVESLRGTYPPVTGYAAARRAREKIRFKRHPWKWIKSKF